MLKIVYNRLGVNFEEHIMAQMNITKDMTTKQRLAVLRRHSKKFNKKLQRNQRVRKTETESYLPYGYPASKGYDDVNINAWTDAPQYAEKHYGDRMRDTVSHDNDWN